MGSQDDPGDSIAFTIPINVAPGGPGYSEGSLQDHMGLPPGIDFEHSVLPMRAYNLIGPRWAINSTPFPRTSFITTILPV